RPGRVRSGDSATGRTGRSSQPGSGPSHSVQAPDLVIPIQYGRYRSGSRLRATCWADFTDTGCSSKPPPKMMPIRVSVMIIPALEFQTVGQGVFDQIAQGVVGVVGAVRADHHVRQLLQPV